MSRLCRFFVFLIAACTVAGCSPIGSIGDSGAVDHFWAVPKRLEYKTGERFLPKNDLELFASYDGVSKSVSLSLVEISIAENPYIPNDLKTVPLDNGYYLEKTGRKLIVVKYSGFDTSYLIEVSASTGSGGTAGIGVNWDE